NRFGQSRVEGEHSGSPDTRGVVGQVSDTAGIRILKHSLHGTIHGDLIREYSWQRRISSEIGQCRLLRGERREEGDVAVPFDQLALRYRSNLIVRVGLAPVVVERAHVLAIGINELERRAGLPLRD